MKLSFALIAQAAKMLASVTGAGFGTYVNSARGIRVACAAVAIAAFAVWPSMAQKSHDLPPPPPQNGAPQTQQSGGQVIFSRSTDENGQTTTQTGPGAAQPAVQMSSTPSASDAERQAVTFTAFDMDVHLRAAEQHIAVRALLTVRNDGKTPLGRIPLQISSALNWEQIRVLGRYAAFAVATLNSDADHTGQLHEAAVPLAVPLAPGQTIQIDVSYSGAIAPSAQRLLAIGTPTDVALHSDWDRISIPFTGLRGFGNVVWYPVSSVPAILGDGARLFDEMGEHKLRLGGAQFRLRLTVEYPHGSAPTVALINGHAAQLIITNPSDLAQEVEGVATADVPSSTLGFEAPSLFVAIRTANAATNTTIWTLPGNEAAVPAWAAAATAVTPFLQGWLGLRPRSQLTLLDLPDPEDAPFEAGALLVTSIRQATPEQLDGILAHALTHAWMQSPRAWLSEGVAHFMGTLWVEKQSNREQALESLESSRAALALAEPSSPGESVGQPLAAAISPVYYRSKAAYVLWMLRDVAGDQTLSAGLRAYNPAADLGKDAGRSSFERLLELAGDRRDLAWFFADWVDADKGLPDLTIDSVFPSTAQNGNWLVAVNISNAGYAAAEVPVTVLSNSSSVTQRVLVPAHGKAVQRVLILDKPTEVQVNDGTIPETQATVHITKLTADTANPATSSSSQTGPQEQ
jgi:hypothetical protein